MGLGSAFSRGLAGLGQGLADVGSKYIDQNMLIARSQALADIQRNSAVQQAKDIDAYTNSPERRASLRDIAAQDIEAEGTARNKVALQGKVDEATNQQLLDADMNRTKAVGKAQADTATQAEIDRGNNPAYIKARRAEALATHIESAGSLASAALARFQLQAAQQTQDLRGRLADAVRRGDDKEETALRAQLDVFDGKGGKKEKFYAVAEKAGAAISAALKSANDPNSDQQTKDEAMATVRQQRMLMEKAAKDAGIDISEAAKKPVAQVHAEAQAALKGGASLDAINKRLTEQGYPTIADPNAKQTAAKRAAQETPSSEVQNQPTPAPAGSPQAKHDEAQAKARADVAARQQAEQQRKQAAQAQFEADAQALTPVDLARKYQDMGMRSQLTLAQLARIKQAESQMLR